MRTPPDGRKPLEDHGFFTRRLHPRHARLTESTCKKCRSFVAASIRPDLLDFIETMHFCMLGSHFHGKPMTSA